MEHNCSAVATPDKAKKIQVVACYIRGLSEATTKRPSFHSPFRPENHSIEPPEVEVIATLPLMIDRPLVLPSWNPPPCHYIRTNQSCPANCLSSDARHIRRLLSKYLSLNRSPPGLR